MHAGFPAAPAPTTVHVPGTTSHTLHGSVHAAPQQVPSAQYPEAHSLAPLQLWPFTFFVTHAPPTHP